MYILNTFTALANLKRSTTSLKVFTVLSSHLIYSIKLFTTFFVNFSFQKLQANYSIFITKNSPFTSINSLIISVYVDNIKIISSRAAVNSLKQQLCSKFKIIDLGPISYYLSMTVTRNYKLKTIIIQQYSYLKHVLQIFHY